MKSIKDKELIMLSRKKKLADISQLKGFTKMERLFLDDSNIEELSPISDCLQLKELNITRSKVKDLSAISNLTQLKKLTIQQTEIKDISALQNLRNLESLNISYSKVDNLDILSNNKKLETLKLDGCSSITEFSVISSLPSLVVLSLGFTQFNDTSLLSNICSFANLCLRRTEIKNLEGIQTLKNLWFLDIQGTHITDFSSLKKLPKLSTLEVGEYVSKINYGVLNGIPVTDLGLDWKTIKDDDLVKFLENI